MPAKKNISNVLANRYASPEMTAIWSPEDKIIMERKLWIFVMKAQAALGVDVPAEAIEAIHAELELDPHRETVVYCNNGARAALEWFVLRFLLGWENVRVYDGSWIEWGNMMRVPIERA